VFSLLNHKQELLEEYPLTRDEARADVEVDVVVVTNWAEVVTMADRVMVDEVFLAVTQAEVDKVPDKGAEASALGITPQKNGRPSPLINALLSWMPEVLQIPNLKVAHPGIKLLRLRSMVQL